MRQWALSDLARKHKLPESTAHNLLKTLQAFGLVRQDPEDCGAGVGMNINSAELAVIPVRALRVD